MGDTNRTSAGRPISDSSTVGRLLAAQEHALQEIAAILHDGPVQDIIAAQFLVSALDGDAAARETVQTTLQGVTEVLRMLCHALHPPALEPFGLFRSVESLVEMFASDMPSTAVHLDQSGDDATLEPWEQQQLYRIVQALVKNVADHAQAQRVDIRLAVTDERITLRVADDGGGIKAIKALSGAGRNGAPQNAPEDGVLAKLVEQGCYGLYLTTMRARTLGGSFKIAPGPDGGTVALLKVERPAPDSQTKK